MALLPYFHLVHAAFVLVLAIWIVSRLRGRLLKVEGRYVLFWLIACVVWVAWYTCKYLDLVGTEFRPDVLILRQGIFYEVLLHTANTAFVFGAGYALARAHEAVGRMMLALDVVLAGLLVTAANLLHAGLFDVFGDVFRTFERPVWKYSAVWLAGLWAMFVIWWLWKKLDDRSDSPKNRKADGHYFVFVLYGVIQLGHPVLVHLEDHYGESSTQFLIALYVVYGAALLLKAACTVVISRSVAPVPSPANA